MAAISFKTPSLSEVIQSYHDNRTFRYSVYAIGILSTYSAGLRFGTQPIHNLLGIATVITLTLTISKTYLEFHRSNSNQTEVVSNLTRSLFTLGLVQVIVLSGLNLAKITTAGITLLKEAAARKPYPMIESMYSITHIGGYAGPSLLFCLRKVDDYFHQKFDVKVNSFILAGMEAWKENKLGELIDSCLAPYRHNDDLKISQEIQTILQRFESFKKLKLHEIKQIISLISRIFFGKAKYFNKKNPTPLDRTRMQVNSTIFYSLTFLFTGTQVYCNPIPTAAAFLCGLFYPTQMQSKKNLIHTWEKAPDFVGLSFIDACKSIHPRTLLTLAAVRFSYPAAFLQGLLLAESFRYYVWPHLSSKINLPIKPISFIDEASTNRWLFFLGKESFEKITRVPDNNPEYNNLKQRVLEGRSAKKILELDQPYSEEELKIAVKKWALKFHPDRVPEKRDEATELFKCLMKARDLLAPNCTKDKTAPHQEPESENSKNNHATHYVEDVD